MPVRYLVLVLALFGMSIYAQEVDDCVVVAKAFLKRHSTSQADKTWKSIWNAKCKEKLEENTDYSENRYANEKLLCWMSDNKDKKIEDLTIKDRINMFRVFLLYIEKDFQIPSFAEKFVHLDLMSKLAYDIP